MEIPETKRFIPKGFELGTTLSKPNRSIILDFKVPLKKNEPTMLQVVNYAILGV